MGDQIKGAVALVVVVVWLAYESGVVDWGLAASERPPAQSPAMRGDAKAPTGADTPAAPLMEGRVLPFRVLDAIRNRAMVGGPESVVNVTVHGGTRADWAATAIYLARAAIVRDATFATVEVYTENPWGDRAPEGAKSLAKAYYDPRPGQQKPSHIIDVFLAEREGTDAEVDYDELDAELAEKYEDVSDPDQRMAKADADARRLVIQRYHLPANWKPPEVGELGIGGAPLDGERIVISDAADGEKSLPPLLDCLESDGGSSVFRGCPYDADRYPPALGPRTSSDERGPAQGLQTVWSPACTSASDAMKYATGQIRRLTDYARSPGHDSSSVWQFTGFIALINETEAPLAQAFPLNCPDLQPGEISAFRDSVKALDDQMTANGIPQAP